MKPDQQTLEKLAKKRQFKLRGVVASVQICGANSTYVNILISKGQGEKKKLFYFSAYGKVAMELSKISKGFRIKMWFTIKTNEHNGKYYTNLNIESFEHWVINEEKLKKQQRIQELLEQQKQIDFKSKNF